MKNQKSSSVRTFLRANRGANMVEYIILVGLVAVAAVIAFQTFGNNVKKITGDQADTVSHVPGKGF